MKEDEKKLLKKFADKSTSPSHQRTISLSDIRLARLTTVSDQQLTDASLQGTAAASALNGTNSSSTTGQSTTGGGTIIAIKQETLSTVDNLVGSYVDSTTFLPSPNNQVANLVQNHILATNEASGVVNEGKSSL